MMPTAAGLLKIKIFKNDVYDVTTVDCDVTKMFLSGDLNSMVDVVMWPNFGNSRISMREVTRKITFLEKWSWFKFNNLELALGMTWKYFISVAKGFKLELRRFWGIYPTFVEVTGEKLVGSLVAKLLHLNRVNMTVQFVPFGPASFV